MEVAKVFKDKVGTFLKNKLKLELSEEKTLITNMKEKPAKFLGFQIKVYRRFRLKKRPIKKLKKRKSIRKYYLQADGALLLRVNADRERLINRFYMKGFCDKKGFPKEVGWLSSLEPQIIINRYNSIYQRIFSILYEFYFRKIQHS
jgi:uncharacterized protein (UPF0335 family)